MIKKSVKLQIMIVLLLSLIVQNIIAPMTDISYALDLIESELEQVAPLEEGGGELITILSEPKDLGKIFTFQYLKEGNREIGEGEVIDIKEDTQYSIRYDWNTVEIDVNEGDFASIQVPDVFKFDRDWKDQDIVVDGDLVVGKYSLIGGLLTFTFNDNLKESEVRNGFVEFGFEFNLEKFKEDVNLIVPFIDSVNKEVSIILKPTADAAAISKTGVADSTKDAKSITWTIDVFNTEGRTITNVSLGDIVPEGLSTPRDIIIKELTIGYDGMKYEGGIVGDGVLSEDGFPIIFPSISAYEGYRIFYKTDIIDYSKNQFTNNATLKYEEKVLPAVSTVSGISRSDFIEKDGTKLSDNEIQWFIDVNKAGGEISHAIIEEVMPEGLSVKDGSIQIYKLTRTGNNWAETLQEDIIFKSFPINLGKITSSEAYRIKFVTSIDYASVNEGFYQVDNSFENKAILRDSELVIGEGKKEITVSRDTILDKSGLATVNYNFKEINWTLHINKAKHPIENAVIIDSIPAGLELDVSSIKIFDVNNNKINLAEDSIRVDGSTTLRIDLGNLDSKYVKVQYKTIIKDFNINSYQNNVSLEGTGVGTGVSKEVSVSIPNNSYGKSYNSIDYNSKTISWSLSINPIREAIKELKIVDTFPNKGLILLEDSLVVKLGNTVLLKDTHYTLSPNTLNEITSYNQGFIIEFINIEVSGLNDRIGITYKTSFDPEKGIEENTSSDRTYKNTAAFIGKTINERIIDLNRTAEHKVIESSWNSGKKDGRRVNKVNDSLVTGWNSGYERLIEWNIYTNYLKQDLGNGVKIVDTISYEGEIISESIRIRTYSVNTNGSTNIGETLDVAEYDVNLSEDKKTVTITFKDEVKERYVLTLLTTVPDKSQNTYTNRASLNVGDEKYPYSASVSYDKYNSVLDKKMLDVSGSNVYSGDELDWLITINESLSVIENASVKDTISHGMVYLNDSLKVYKYKGTSRELLDSSLYSFSKEGNTLIIDFHETIEYKYEIHYKTVVTSKEGQINNKAEFVGNIYTMISKETSKVNVRQFSSIGGNVDPKKGKLEISKKDDENKLIEKVNAKFQLWYILNGEYVKFGDDFETSNGILSISNLPLRTYYIKEIEAPGGYISPKYWNDWPQESTSWPDAEEWPEDFVVNVNKSYNNNEENSFKLDIKNIRKKLDISGRKIWDGGPEVKGEIELQLYRNGDKYLEPVSLDGSEKDSWSYTWENLYEYDEFGERYNYSVDEVETPEFYEKSISDDGLTITNKYVSPKISITGNKEWVGGPVVKPTIHLQLFRDSSAFGDPVELAPGTFNYTWGNLDKTDHYGKDYSYTVDEVKVPENYQRLVSDDYLTITNTYESPVTDIVGRKVWKDGDFNRPDSIELQLYRKIAGGEDESIGEPVVLEAGYYQYSWKDMAVTDTNGNTYDYWIKEVETPVNYLSTSDEDPLTIINQYIIPQIEVTGYKEWIGGGSIKPTVRIQLYRQISGEGKEAVGEAVIFEDGKSSHTWTELDETDLAGRKYKYSIDEFEVPTYYYKVISSDGLTIENRYSPPFFPIPEESGDPEDEEEVPIDNEEEATENEEEPDEEKEEVEINDNTPGGVPNVDEDDDTDTPTLPKTSESNSIYVIIIGGLFIAFGTLVGYRNKKKKS